MSDDCVESRWAGFFEWASTSPLSRAAAAARASHLRRGVEATDPTEFQASETAALSSLRDLLHRLVGAQQGDHVVLGRSIAELFSVTAGGWRSEMDRDEVVLVEPNHPVATLAWLGAARRGLLRTLVVPARRDQSCDLDGAREAVSDRSAAVVATHVGHLSGVVQPISDLAQIAHRVGAPLVVDGAQAVGRIAVDVADLGCDLYAGVGRKALRAPLGTAFMVGSEPVLDSIEPVLWSTRAAQPVSGPAGIAMSALPARLEANLPDLSALSALAASVREVLHTGVRQVETHVAGLMPLLTELGKSGGSDPTVPPTGRNAGIVQCSLPANVDSQRLKAALRQEGFVVAAGHRTLRASVHLPNQPADLEALAEAVKKHVAAA